MIAGCDVRLLYPICHPGPERSGGAISAGARHVPESTGEVLE